MKRFFLIPVLLLALCSVSSCEDDSKNPLPEEVVGQYVRLDVDRYHRQLLYTDIDNTYFGGLLTTPGNNVVRFDIVVRRNEFTTTEAADYVPLMTITQFPYDLKITPAMLAQALGLQVSDLRDGDFFRFYGYSYDANGKVATFRNLSPLNQFTAAMEQGYRLNTNLTSHPVPTGDTDEPYDNRNPS